MRPIHSSLLIAFLSIISINKLTAQESTLCKDGGTDSTVGGQILITTISDTGIEKYGSHTVCVGYFNLLRYNESAGISVTLANSPTLPTQIAQAPIKSPEVAADKQTGANPIVKALQQSLVQQVDTAKLEFAKTNVKSVDPGVAWSLLVSEFQKNNEKKAEELHGTMQESYQDAALVIAKYSRVLSEHSELLEASTAALHDLHVASNPDIVFHDYKGIAWNSKEVSEAILALNQFADQYSALRALPGFGTWLNTNKDAYTFIIDRIAALKASYQGLDVNGDAVIKLFASQKQVEDARTHFKHVFDQTAKGNSEIARTIPVPCDQWFGKSKTAVVQILVQDRLDTKPSDPTIKKTVRVICQSTLTVTSGVGFTRVGEKVPSFEPLDTSGTQSLGYSSQAATKPLYAFHVNSSIYDFEKSAVGLHGQVGAAFSGTATDSASLEYLFGGAFSFAHRAVFISPSLHLAKRTTYIDGFGPGTSNTAKGTLTSLPTQQTWKTGFAMTISFAFMK